MKELTKEKLAELLDGRDMTSEYDTPTWEDALYNNLVVLYGHSNYFIEVRGTVYSSIYSDGDDQLALVLAGEEISLDGKATFIDVPSILPLSYDDNHDDCPRRIAVQHSYYGDQDDAQNVYWEFDTVMPHATFLLNNSGKLFCKGIVIDLDEVKPVK